MTTVRTRSRVACVVVAMALLFLFAPVMAGGHGDPNRPVKVTFTKWIPVPQPDPPRAGPLMAGVTGGDIAGAFVGEVLWRQTSLNGHVTGLEAMYEVYAADEDRSFSALIRGGQNQAGLGQLDGVILAGWRTGAPVRVVFQVYPLANPACADVGGAPTAAPVCFVGTIHVGRAPRD